MTKNLCYSAIPRKAQFDCHTRYKLAGSTRSHTEPAGTEGVQRGGGSPELYQSWRYFRMYENRGFNIKRKFAVFFAHDHYNHEVIFFKIIISFA